MAVTVDAPAGSRLGRLGRVRFASADFAFNLYWQSVTLYLLYYYTDVVGIAVAAASLIYMAGSIWDGIVDLAVGILADRMRLGRGGFRGYLLAGAVPLGLSFALLYAAPRPGDRQIAAIVIAHFAFRTLYAAVNVPYSALTARVTDDSCDRASISGLRMIFGTLAAIVVALGTQPLAAASGADAPRGYAIVAILFAGVGTAILIRVGRRIDEHIPAARIGARHDLHAAARALITNRALVTLVVAMMFAIVGVTILDKLILYQFKYALGDEPAGRAALAMMSVAGGIAIPFWMAIGRWLGGRLVWLIAALGGLGAVAGYAIAAAPGVIATQAMLVATQVAMMGVNFAFWAMLPDTIEYGEQAGGLRIEATTFGIAALSQKFAIGGAAGVFGLVFAGIGYRANATQGAATLSGMRTMLLFAPVIGFALSAAAIALNPLRRGTHARIVAGLREGAS